MLLTFSISNDGGHFVTCSRNKMQRLRRRESEGEKEERRGVQISRWGDAFQVCNGILVTFGYLAL